jgi:aldehyde dehydrogenase
VPWHARKKIKQSHPLDLTTMIGAQASNDQLEKILSYFDIGKQEGAKVLTGGKRSELGGEIAEGCYVEPTIFEGNNRIRVFQEEIFGPVVSVATLKDDDERSPLPTTRCTGLAQASGHATATAPIALAAPFRPGGSGPTAIMPIRRMPPSAATRRPASAARTTR